MIFEPVIFDPVTFVLTAIALVSVALTVATIVSVAYCNLVPSRSRTLPSRD